MDHDFGFRGEIAVFDACGGRMKEIGDVVVGRGGAERPEETGCDLVTDADDCWADVVGGQAIANVLGIIIEFPSEVTDVGGPA